MSSIAGKTHRQKDRQTDIHKLIQNQIFTIKNHYSHDVDNTLEEKKTGTRGLLWPTRWCPD